MWKAETSTDTIMREHLLGMKKDVICKKVLACMYRWRENRMQTVQEEEDAEEEGECRGHYMLA